MLRRNTLIAALALSLAAGCSNSSIGGTGGEGGGGGSGGGGGTGASGGTGGASGSGGAGGGGGDLLAAQIVRPNGSLSILLDSQLTFEAEFQRDGATVQPDTVSWSSSVKGFLGEGNPLADVILGVGDHAVTVTGVLDGRSALDTVDVSVGDFEVLILQPDTADRANVGDLITFEGTARVVEDVITTTLESAGGGAGRQATFEWHSSIDGPIGVDDTFDSNALSIGEHTINLTVTDDLAGGTGLSGNASLPLTILAPNSRPTVTITDPAACPVEIVQGGTLTLTGEVTDPDAADAGLVASWVDTLTGQIGNDGTFLLTGGDDLGVHRIVLSATDSQGASDEASCDVLVVPAGGSAADIFPDTQAINDALVNGDPDVGFIGTDGAGNIIIGNDEGVTIFGSDPSAANTYDGTDLGLVNPQARVTDVIISGDIAWVATEIGLAECAYDAAAGVLSNCVELSNGDFQGLILSGDPAVEATLAGAVDGGLYIASYSGGSLVNDDIFDDGSSNLPGNDVGDVLFVGDTLYVATNNGLCIAPDPAGTLADPGAVDLCGEVVNDNNSILPNNEIRAMAWDGDYLWLGSDGGLVRYNPETGAMVLFSDDDGLPDNTINDVEVDDGGIIWVATDAGVGRLDPTTDLITPLTHDDFGLPVGTQFQSIYIDADGVKWIGTDEGVVQYTGA